MGIDSYHILIITCYCLSLARNSSLATAMLWPTFSEDKVTTVWWPLSNVGDFVYNERQLMPRSLHRLGTGQVTS